MRLLFITGSLVHGGAERHTITLANRLAERGHECHAVYVKDDPGQLERLRGAASVRCLQARRYLDLSAVDALALFFEQVRPTVVVTANPSRTKGDNRGALKTLHRTADGFGWGTRPGETIE